MELAPECAKPRGQLEGRARRATTVETPSWSGRYCRKPNKQGPKTPCNPLNKTAAYWADRLAEHGAEPTCAFITINYTQWSFLAQKSSWCRDLILVSHVYLLLSI